MILSILSNIQNFGKEKLFPRWKLVTDPVGLLLLDLLDLRFPDRIHGRDLEGWIRENELENVEREFLLFFAERSWRYFSVVMLSICLIYSIEIYAVNLPDQSYGLYLDLLGAVILGRGLLNDRYTISNMGKNSQMYPSPILIFKCRDTVDGVWGISLLVIGILLQFASVAF